MIPARHTLGAILLAAGRPAEAGQVYEEDLRRHPENGWALAGLRDSLRATAAPVARQQEVEKRLVKAWRRADVLPLGSRL